MFFCIILIQFNCVAQTIHDLEIVTEVHPPFNFVENGVVAGIATDILVKILSDIKSNINRRYIKLVPWVRGYNLIQLKSKNNVFLYSTA